LSAGEHPRAAAAEVAKSAIFADLTKKRAIRLGGAVQSLEITG